MTASSAAGRDPTGNLFDLDDTAAYNDGSRSDAVPSRVACARRHQVPTDQR